MGLLPEDNRTREFILNELEFALLLSAPGEGVEFPISDTHAYPKVNELVNLVKYLPGDFILKVDIERVYETMRRMQEIEVTNDEEDNNSMEEFDHELISKHQVYEIFIMRMIELDLVQSVIPFIRKILAIEFPNPQYNTLYLILLVLRIAPELNDDTKHGLMSLIGHRFEDQEQLIKVIEFYINTKMTSLDKGKYIALSVSSLIQNQLNYSLEHGCLFKDAFLK